MPDNANSVENINDIQKNAEVVLVASNEAGLEVNAERISYVLMFPYQNSKQSHDT
jgi:pyruvate kinase